MNKIELIPTELSTKYRKKWNICKSSNDFNHLYLNGKKISNALYRVGGFGVKLEDKYFMLLKQVESRYGDSITTDRKKKLYLANCSVIIDCNGNEKIVFDQYNYGYLVDGQIYVLNNNYYNIETKELYSNCYSSISSEHFLFLDNRYDDDKSKRGVLKINKADGTTELIQ